MLCLTSGSLIAVPLPNPLPDRWAVVTGASSGIGVELARGLAKRGHGVILVARRLDRLESLADELRAWGGAAEAVKCDLADPGQRASLLGYLEDKPVSVLCNNAGFACFGNVADADPAGELRQIELNVTAVAELTYALIPAMVARRSGAVLMLGSTAGFQPIPGSATYAASKAFVHAFAQALHSELHGTGVSCTLLTPGPVATEFNRTAGIAPHSDAHLTSISLTPQQVAETALRALDRGRRITIPGAVAKLQVAGSTLTPRPLLLPIMRRLSADLQSH
jgi:short-subunit dehydrogenase